MKFDLALRLMLEKGARIRREHWLDDAYLNLHGFPFVISEEDVRGTDWVLYGGTEEQKKFNKLLLLEEAEKNNILGRIERKIDELSRAVDNISGGE